ARRIMKKSVLRNRELKVREEFARANLWLVALFLFVMSDSVLAQPTKSATSDPAAVDVATLNHQADTVEKSEQHEIAIELLKRAVRLAPGSTATLRNVGAVCVHANKPLLTLTRLQP